MWKDIILPFPLEVGQDLPVKGIVLFLHCYFCMVWRYDSLNQDGILARILILPSSVIQVHLNLLVIKECHYM